MSTTQSTAPPHISTPLQLGDLTLRNRNVMASLTRNRAVPTNVPNKFNVEYYTQRAKGGAGLIMSEGTLVSQQGTEWPNAPGLWSDEQVAGWRAVTDSVHAAGSLMFCQLWHVGRVAHPDMDEQKRAGTPVPGPSAIAAQGGKFRSLPGQPGYVVPTPIEDPWDIVNEFRNAAKLAKKAGFDGVELQSGNGSLIHQFLDYSANEREDQWGGSVGNRCRLGLECMRALIEVWGPARVGIKLSPCAGYNDVGMPLPDTIMTFTYYITQLASMKPAYVQLLRYVPFLDAPVESSSDKVFKRGVPHDVLAVYAGLIKPPPSALEEHTEAHIRGPAMPKPEYDSKNPSPTRVFINGGLNLDEAEKLISDGVVDAAVFGCLWLANPDLQKRVEKRVPLNGNLDFRTFYDTVDNDPRTGYSDYPEANP